MEIITKEDIINAVRDTGVTIKEGAIVLIRTGRDALMGKKEYMSSGTGMSAEATEWLIDQGVGLHQLPLQGFKVMAMPLPLHGCTQPHR